MGGGEPSIRLFLHNCRLILALKLSTCASNLAVCIRPSFHHGLVTSLDPGPHAKQKAQTRNLPRGRDRHTRRSAREEGFSKNCTSQEREELAGQFRGIFGDNWSPTPGPTCRGRRSRTRRGSSLAPPEESSSREREELAGKGGRIFGDSWPPTPGRTCEACT